MTDPSSPTTEPDHQFQQSDNQDSPHRHTTLKKKSSVRRSASKRSKAETANTASSLPRSLTSHEEPRNDPTRSPLYCPVPVNSDPTVVLAARFQGTSF